jgi:hypothetical protein
MCPYVTEGGTRYGGAIIDPGNASIGVQETDMFVAIEASPVQVNANLEVSNVRSIPIVDAE